MDLEEGMRIACKINNHIIDDSSIQEHEGNLYICQDKADGYDCPDKLGYKYSWRIDKGNNIDLLDAGVEQVSLQEIFSGCTASTLKAEAGKLKSIVIPKVLPEVIRKSL